MSRQQSLIIGAVILLGSLAIGQVAAFFIAPRSWLTFIDRLPVILSMIAFWGPICAILAAALVYLTMRLLGFDSLEAVRRESVDQNNPAPAIVFVGTLIAVMLFLNLVIRP
jgi:hypothetical protein